MLNTILLRQFDGSVRQLNEDSRKVYYDLADAIGLLAQYHGYKISATLYLIPTEPFHERLSPSFLQWVIEKFDAKAVILYGDIPGKEREIAYFTNGCSELGVQPIVLADSSEIPIARQLLSSIRIWNSQTPVSEPQPNQEQTVFVDSQEPPPELCAHCLRNRWFEDIGGGNLEEAANQSQSKKSKSKRKKKKRAAHSK